LYSCLAQSRLFFPFFPPALANFRENAGPFFSLTLKCSRARVGGSDVFFPLRQRLMALRPLFFSPLVRGAGSDSISFVRSLTAANDRREQYPGYFSFPSGPQLESSNVFFFFFLPPPAPDPRVLFSAPSRRAIFALSCAPSRGSLPLSLSAGQTPIPLSNSGKLSRVVFFFFRGYAIGFLLLLPSLHPFRPRDRTAARDSALFLLSPRMVGVPSAAFK